MTVDGQQPLRLDLVLVWHMHQPDYRGYADGEFRLPWVYLHAIKDYTDMAWHLEHHPGMRAVVNFTPVLLDQIEDYADQFATGTIRDPLLRLLAQGEERPLNSDERMLILASCFHANHERIIHPFPPYKALHEILVRIEAQGPEAAAYVSDQYLHDALTWYHLCWTGETVRRESELVTRLMAKGAQFVHAERVALFELIGALLRDLIPRWSRLALRGQVELSTTPEHHPLAPLLLRFASAREATPAMKLPEAPEYPGGGGRVAAQLETAVREHARRFGTPATGVWPAEGAVSSDLLALFAEHGIRWTASGGQVLRNSLLAAGVAADGAARWLYRPYRLQGPAPEPVCFFRDDRLSDYIGFEYAKWNNDDAAANLVAELVTIARATPAGEVPVVSVILDGENCWEYYPYNGYFFLSALYGALESHPVVRPTTCRDWLDGRVDPYPAGRIAASIGALDRLTAGSWVGGNFTTWIGSPEKNHAWDLLCAAKQSFDLVAGSGRLSAERLRLATRQLATCEASDWCWWFSDANPAVSVAAFDRLFRGNLAHLHVLLDLPVPAALSQPICRGGELAEGSGAMRRASEGGEFDAR